MGIVLPFTSSKKEEISTNGFGHFTQMFYNVVDEQQSFSCVIAYSLWLSCYLFFFYHGATAVVDQDPLIVEYSDRPHSVELYCRSDQPHA
jgi:hypothetical protein